MGENGLKIKIWSDFLGNLYSSQCKGAEYEFDIDILRFYIKNLFYTNLTEI